MNVKFIVHKGFGQSRRAGLEMIPLVDETPENYAEVTIGGGCAWVNRDSLTDLHAEPLDVEPGGASPDQSVMGSCTGGVATPEAGEAAATASRPSEGQATS